MEPSIFLEFQLPNAATWFYFALFLTVALFFQFARPLSIRNLDLLMLFLLVAQPAIVVAVALYVAVAVTEVPT